MGGRPKQRAFPGRADQIANARDFTRRVLASARSSTMRRSSLANWQPTPWNTATGSGGQFDIIIYRDETLIIIAVKDEGSDNAPAARPHDELAEDGRGLRLVERIADRWGCYGNERGRTIWLELRWKTLRADARQLRQLGEPGETRPAAAFVAPPGGVGLIRHAERRFDRFG